MIPSLARKIRDSVTMTSTILVAGTKSRDIRATDRLKEDCWHEK